MKGKIKAKDIKRVQADLKGAWIKGGRLIGFDLSDRELDNSTFENLNLTRANFKGSSLNGARFIRCNLNRVNFEGVRFIGGRVERSSLHHSSFKDAVVKDGVFERVRGERVIFQNVAMDNSRFVRVSLLNSSFKGCRGEGVLMKGAKLEGNLVKDSNFKKGDFSSAILNLSYLIASDFSNSKFTKCRMEMAKLIDSSFDSCDMKGIYLKEGEIIDCDFTNADLEKGFLYRAKIESPNFVKTNLRNTYFKGIEWMPYPLSVEIKNAGGVVDSRISERFFRFVGESFAFKVIFILIIFIAFLFFLYLNMKPERMDYQTLLRKAEERQSKGDIESAINFYKLSLEKGVGEREKIRVKLALSDLLQVSGRSGEAETYIDSVYKSDLSLSQEKRDALLKRANIQRGKGDIDGALNSLNEALTMEKEREGSDGNVQAGIMREIGDTLISAGRFEEAYETFMLGTKIEGISQELAFQLYMGAGAANKAKGDLEGAIKIMMEGVESYGDENSFIQTVTEVGNIYISLQKWKEAEETFSLLLERLPEKDEAKLKAWTGIANIRLHQGMDEEALELFEKSGLLMGDRPEIHAHYITMSEISLRLPDGEERAIAYLNELLARRGSDPSVFIDAHLRLGKIYMNMGELQKAKDQLLEAYERSVGTREGFEALRYVIEIEEGRDNNEEVQRLLKRLRTDYPEESEVMSYIEEKEKRGK